MLITSMENLTTEGKEGGGVPKPKVPNASIC